MTDPQTTNRLIGLPTTTIDANALRARLRGPVLVAGDPGWDDVRGVYNTRLEQQPAIIALPENVSDVIAIVTFANTHSMRIVPQRTGHNAEPLGSLEDAILLRTDRMRDVSIDASRLRARVGAGAKWEDVVPLASDLGLAALHGSTPDVSIAGYVMGGGVGWYGRKLGLAANSVTGFEIVTADGRLRWVDAEHDAELFWALRGGGGSFGVVTTVEIQLYEMPQLYAGILFFDWERAAEVLHAWRAWTTTVPDETTSVGRLLHFPDAPDVPEALRGGSFVLVEAFHIGDEREGMEILRPLRQLGPVADTFAMMPPVGLAEIHMDPPRPLAYLTDHLVLGDLTGESIDDLVAAVGPGSGSRLDSVEIRHLGGAMGRAEETHGALAKLPGEYIVFGIGVADDAAAEHRVRSELDAMIESVWSAASGLYFNFTEHRVDPASIFPPETYQRLRAIKRAVDPDNRFRANHSIPPEDEAAAPELLASRREAHVVSNSLTVTIDAPVDVTELAVRQVDLATPARRALAELGLDDRVTLRPGGLTWHQRAGRAPIEIDLDIRVEPHGENCSSLSIATRFSAADEGARLGVVDAWALVGPVSSTLTERAARSVKAYAERDTFDGLRGLETELRAA